MTDYEPIYTLKNKANFVRPHQRRNEMHAQDHARWRVFVYGLGIHNDQTTENKKTNFIAQQKSLLINQR